MAGPAGATFEWGETTCERETDLWGKERNRSKCVYGLVFNLLMRKVCVSD